MQGAQAASSCFPGLTFLSPHSLAGRAGRLWGARAGGDCAQHAAPAPHLLAQHVSTEQPMMTMQGMRHKNCCKAPLCLVVNRHSLVGLDSTRLLAD